MKKLFAILAVTAVMTSCNDTTPVSDAQSDSAKAAATADSLAAAQAPVDTTAKVLDSASVKIDTTVKVAVDTTKK